MAELHVIGDIECGHDFGGGKVFCVFELVTGNQWTVVEGRTSGCTHIMEHTVDGVQWNFPIDVHYSFDTVQGWPKLSIQVWRVDAYGRKAIAGYGVAFLPLPSAEEQTVEIVTWIPAVWYDSFIKRTIAALRLFVMGGNPVLRDTALIHGNEERFKLHTIGSGSVYVKLHILSRGMQSTGLKYA